MYVYVCTRICVYTYVHVHVYVDTHLHILYVYIYIYTYVKCVYTYIAINTYIHMYINTHIHKIQIYICESKLVREIKAHLNQYRSSELTGPHMMCFLSPSVKNFGQGLMRLLLTQRLHVVL